MNVVFNVVLCACLVLKFSFSLFHSDFYGVPYTKQALSIDTKPPQTRLENASFPMKGEKHRFGFFVVYLIREWLLSLGNVLQIMATFGNKLDKIDLSFVIHGELFGNKFK